MQKISTFEHGRIEKKWQAKWKKEKTYKVINKEAKKYYLLVELAYTSGDLHMGHWFAWTAPDAYARFKRMSGNNVLFPVGGFDAFGLPAENAAIRKGIHPKDWTYKNIKAMRSQFATMGPSFDWDKEVITSDLDYYRWTQWLFLKLYQEGLAYKDKVWSNWCGQCKTVLANEHVIDGCCWRHPETPVVQKQVPQWLFAITKYADRLIWPEKPEVDWPKEAREAQNHWIGKSEGIEIKFRVEANPSEIMVFTTRPDTIFGAMFLVLAPEHPLALKLAKSQHKEEVKKYIEESRKKLERERLEEARQKTGVFTGAYALNPLSQERIPVFIADFVLTGYGTGAIMGVPGHDKRDWEFAKTNNLPIRQVITGGDVEKSAYEEEGRLVNSEDFNGLTSEEAREKISKYIEGNQLGRRSTQYHLRDWTISRQRYWGAPIPIIYCDNCGTVPVPEKDLPVPLPEKVDYTPTGKPPLATAEGWVKVKCPKCGRDAKRDTETMDTYVDSSWYFLRYPAPDYKEGPFDTKTVGKWFPLEVYFGGPEHILGHTLYARFITKVLNELGYLPFDEFARVRRHHGVILGPDGARMSKSRGNVVNPDEEVRKFGADAVRLYIAFLGPHEKGGAWNREAVEGTRRFLNRVWVLVNDHKDFVLEDKKDAREILTFQHKTVQRVTQDLEKMQFNTAIARIMEFVNLLYDKVATKPPKAKRKIRCAEWDEALKTLCLLLAPFTPHLTEEIWVNVLRQKFSVHRAAWPTYREELLKTEEVTIPVQVDGRLRGQITVASDLSSSQDEVERRAQADKNVSKWISGKKVKKVFFAPGRLINLVTS